MILRLPRKAEPSGLEWPRVASSGSPTADNETAQPLRSIHPQGWRGAQHEILFVLRYMVHMETPG